MYVYTQCIYVCMYVYIYIYIYIYIYLINLECFVCHSKPLFLLLRYMPARNLGSSCVRGLAKVVEDFAVERFCIAYQTVHATVSAYERKMLPTCYCPIHCRHQEGGAVCMLREML